MVSRPLLPYDLSGLVKYATGAALLALGLGAVWLGTQGAEPVAFQQEAAVLANGQGSVRASTGVSISPLDQSPGLAGLSLAHREPDPSWPDASSFPFASRTFGYAFDTPAGVEIDDADEPYLDATEGTARVQGGLYEFSPVSPAYSVADALGEQAPADPFRTLALRRLARGCDADGPDGGTTCDRVHAVRELTSAHGLRVLEVELVMREERYVRSAKARRVVARRVVGPVYAVDVSREGWLRALIVHHDVHEPATAAEPRLARSVALSVALTRGWQPAAPGR
jgi:hypothetical protein